MRASAILFSLFVAGAISSPVKREIVYDEVVVYKTITVSDDGSTPQPRRQRTSNTPSFTPAATSVTPAAISVTPTSTTPLPSVTPSVTPTTPSFTPVEASVTPAEEPTSTTPPPPPSTTPTPAPTSQPAQQPTASSGSDGSPLNGGKSLLSISNYWRDVYGLSHFTWDAQLEKNALKTGTDGRGQNQVHQLNPGTMAQVITPGMDVPYGNITPDTPFELSYVAWLCEVPSDKLKQGGTDQCKLVSDNLHMYYSDTGHYDILTSTSYSRIGCAFADNPDSDNNTPYQGLWVCDLA